LLERERAVAQARDLERINHAADQLNAAFTHGEGLSTQVPIGPDEGLKHSSWIMCDNLVSLRKADLTNFIGSLSSSKVTHLNEALQMALDLI
jgi:mRNA interferase MazF